LAHAVAPASLISNICGEPGTDAVVHLVDGEERRSWSRSDQRRHVFVRVLCEPIPRSFVRDYSGRPIAGIIEMCSNTGSRSSSMYTVSVRSGLACRMAACRRRCGTRLAAIHVPKVFLSA